MKLNQLIAIANGEKSRKESVFSKIYQSLKQLTLFDGISKRYTPIDEDGEKFPDENKNVQLTVLEAIEAAVEVCGTMYNIVLSQDEANCRAKADVKVDGVIVLEQVPVTSLLFLEKQLIDMNTFVGALPVLDPAETWKFEEAVGYYKSNPSKTTKSKKISKPFVKYEATKEHPAQVDVVHEDILVGNWETIKFSGAMKKSDKEELLLRIRKLSNAVKEAREEANGIDVKAEKEGNKVLDFIFKGFTK